MKKLLISIIIISLLLCGCAQSAPAPEVTAVPTPEVTPVPVDNNIGKVRISELMPKNHSSLRDEDGDFSDWIELENCSGESLSLEGWHISDGASEGWALPATELPAGERLLIFASGKDKAENELHADFKLSEGETVSLLTPMQNLSHSADCGSTEADYALVLSGEGFVPSFYPTPGYENTAQGYELWQESLSVSGPLVINEVMSSNIFGLYRESTGKRDWVEIKNISGSPVELSDYYLSDDEDDYRLWQLPQRSLAPGHTFIALCTKDDYPAFPCTGFELNSTMEQLYLSDNSGLVDCMTVRDLQPNMSYGRLDGENGYFFFASPSLGDNNYEGFRRISETPVALSPDGVFNNVDSVTAELSGVGTIHYTTDGSLPTEQSPVYEGPLTITETCVLRAVSVEEGALPSRPLSLSYIINENHSLPVVSIAADSPDALTGIFLMGIKDREVTGSMSFYEDGGSFTMGCGVSVTGHDSLRLEKKSLKVNFRGVYGDERLEYDLFGSELKEFSSLALRSGQDSHRLIFRQDIWQDLCLEMTDNVLTQHSKYCIVYLNGEYYGIYCIKENISAGYYADTVGVSKDSVESHQIPDEIFDFCYENDLSIPENYEKLCTIMDMDSYIDWAIIEGVSANTDLFINTRFFRSSEGDGRWQSVLFDLDHTMINDFSTLFAVGKSAQDPYFPFKALNGQSYFSSPLMTVVFTKLCQNEEFLDKFLTRYAEVYDSVLSNERILERIDHYEALLEPEVERDWTRWYKDPGKWQLYVEHLRHDIVTYDWQNYAKDSLAYYLNLSEEQMAEYFN